jgi:hypothetical protein
MGSLPRLKIKDEIRYRKGSTNESVNCQACEHYRKAWYRFVNNPAGPDIIEDRCEVIGLNHESRRYRVRPDNTCDRQQMSLKWRKELDVLAARGRP